MKNIDLWEKCGKREKIKKNGKLIAPKYKVLVQQCPALFQKVSKSALFHPVPILTPALAEPNSDSTFSNWRNRKRETLIPGLGLKKSKNVFPMN